MRRQFFNVDPSKECSNKDGIREEFKKRLVRALVLLQQESRNSRVFTHANLAWPHVRITLPNALGLRRPAYAGGDVSAEWEDYRCKFSLLVSNTLRSP